MRSCLLGLKYEGAKLSTYGSAKLQYARKQAADEPVAAIMRLPQIATVVDANEPDCGCFKCKLSLFLGSLATSTKLLLCSLCIPDRPTEARRRCRRRSSANRPPGTPGAASSSGSPGLRSITLMSC